MGGGGGGGIYAPVIHNHSPPHLGEGLGIVWLIMGQPQGYQLASYDTTVTSTICICQSSDLEECEIA